MGVLGTVSQESIEFFYQRNGAGIPQRGVDDVRDLVDLPRVGISY